MTPAQAKFIIRNRFSEDEVEDAWWHRDDGEAYLKLFDQLVVVMSAEDALGVLGTAYSAAANEYGA